MNLKNFYLGSAWQVKLEPRSLAFLAFDFDGGVVELEYVLHD